MDTQVRSAIEKSLKTNFINVWYAHFSVRIHAAERLELYRKLMSLLRNRFSLMDALERLYSIASKDGKNPDDANAIATAFWMQSVRNGGTFSEALRGWVPNTEILMLSVGDVAALDVALQHTIRVVGGMNKMRSLVWGAVSYPLFLVLMVALLVWAVAQYMVPPMMDAVPGIVWHGTAKSLVDLSFCCRYCLFNYFSILVWQKPIQSRLHSPVVHLSNLYWRQLVVITFRLGESRYASVKSDALFGR